MRSGLSSSEKPMKEGRADRRADNKQGNGARRNADSTRRSTRMAPQLRTDRVLRCLASEFEGDPVYSIRHGLSGQVRSRLPTACRALVSGPEATPAKQGQGRPRAKGVFSSVCVCAVFCPSGDPRSPKGGTRPHLGCGRKVGYTSRCVCYRGARTMPILSLPYQFKLVSPEENPNKTASMTRTHHSRSMRPALSLTAMPRRVRQVSFGLRR